MHICTYVCICVCLFTILFQYNRQLRSRKKHHCTGLKLPCQSMERQSPWWIKMDICGEGHLILRLVADMTNSVQKLYIHVHACTLPSGVWFDWWDDFYPVRIHNFSCMDKGHLSRWAAGLHLTCSSNIHYLIIWFLEYWYAHTWEICNCIDVHTMLIPDTVHIYTCMYVYCRYVKLNLICSQQPKS